MSELQAFRLWLSGRVQGVGFRWFTRQAARELGLTGRVRNLPDGRMAGWRSRWPAGASRLRRFAAGCSRGHQGPG